MIQWRDKFEIDVHCVTDIDGVAEVNDIVDACCL